MRVKTVISYRKNEDVRSAIRLSRILENERHHVFSVLGIAHLRKAQSTSRKKLRRRIQACDLMLVIIGPRWLSLLSDRESDDDDNMVFSIRAAFEMSKDVIPVCIDGARMPRSDTLPEAIRPLARMTSIELRPERFEDDCQSLMATILSTAAPRIRYARTIARLIEPTEGDEPQRVEETSLLPTVPAQTKSAHFTIRDGLITSIPTQQFEEDENDYGRLEALREPLLDAVRQAEELLSAGNMPFFSVLDALGKYKNELEKGSAEANYTILYAYGLQLANRYDSTLKLIDDGELPEIDPNAIAPLRSVIQLHGPFILSSKDGRDLVTDAERYARSPASERAFQAQVKEFGELLAQQTDIVEQETSIFIKDITDISKDSDNISDVSQQFERRYLFTRGAAKNLVIVLSAGAVVASAAFIPAVGPYVAASLGLVTVEALKKSKAFTDLSTPIRERLDDLSQIDIDRIKYIPREKLEKIKQFVMHNIELITKVGGNAREMQWFRDVVEWIGRSKYEVSRQQADASYPVATFIVRFSESSYEIAIRSQRHLDGLTAARRNAQSFNDPSFGSNEEYLQWVLESWLNGRLFDEAIMDHNSSYDENPVKSVHELLQATTDRAVESYASLLLE